MKKYFNLIIVIIYGSLNLINAQTVTEKKPFSQWWLSSSMADSVDRYLFHAEAQYSYTKMTGAIDGEMHSGAASIAIRKNIFTNHTEYMIDKMALSLKSLGMNYATESQVFTDYIDVDVTHLLYVEGGFIWERDNSLFINNRYSLYAGIGLNGLIYERHYLKVLFAAGNINQDYTIPVDGIDVLKGAHSAFYIKQEYKFVMNQMLSLMEQAYYFTNINYYNRYRLGASLNLNIVIVQPVSLVLGYNYKYDKESELLGAIAANTTQTIGVKISL